MNTTLKKTNTMNICSSEQESTNDIENDSSSQSDKLCLKMLDYFVF